MQNLVSPSIGIDLEKVVSFCVFSLVEHFRCTRYRIEYRTGDCRFCSRDVPAWVGFLRCLVKGGGGGLVVSPRTY